MHLEKYLISKARSRTRTIVFPEASFSEKIIQAIKIINKRKIAKVILIGDESALVMRFKKLPQEITIISPKISSLTDELAQKLFELRKEKGVTLEEAKGLIQDPFYFAVMMVEMGYADGIVGGVEVETAKFLRPVLEIIKSKELYASATFLFFGKHKTIKLPLFISDAGIIQKPTQNQFALIAKQTVETMKKLFPKEEAKVAFLSYSTKGSAEHEDVTKMREAKELFSLSNPTVLTDGEMQLDAALIPDIANIKCKESIVGGKANILIVPDLNVGNIVCNVIQYFANMKGIGLIVQGLNKPVNNLLMGCSVNDIINLTCVTVLQCE